MLSHCVCLSFQGGVDQHRRCGQQTHSMLSSSVETATFHETRSKRSGTHPAQTSHQLFLIHSLPKRSVLVGPQPPHFPSSRQRTPCRIVKTVPNRARTLPASPPEPIAGVAQAITATVKLFGFLSMVWKSVLSSQLRMEPPSDPAAWHFFLSYFLNRGTIRVQ